MTTTKTGKNKGETGEKSNSDESDNLLVKKQINILFLRLDAYCETQSIATKASNGKYTKNSLQKFAKHYNTKTSALKKKLGLTGLKGSTALDGESIANLFYSSSIDTSKNKYIQYLSGFLLLEEKKISDVEFFKFSYSENTAWQFFIDDIYHHRYILYYWKGQDIQIGEVEFLYNPKTDEWESGKFYYYKNNLKGIKYKRNNQRYDIIFLPVNSNSLFAYIMSANKLITQIIIPNSKNAAERSVLFCTYSVADSKGKPASGMGILIKCVNFESIINSINSDGRVSDFIYNILYQRRESISDTEFNVGEVEKIPNFEEIKKISRIAGLWQGIYFRNDKPDTQSDEKYLGGIDTILIYIEESGRVILIDEFENKSARELEGFLSFPEEAKLIKCNFKLEKDKIYQLHLFLEINADPNNNNSSLLEGIYSGWTSSNKPFSTLIQFKKVDIAIEYHGEGKNININETLKKLDPEFLPQFVSKSSPDLDTYLPKDSNLLSFLKNGRWHLNTYKECLPERLLLEHDDSFSTIHAKKFVGKYFLVSLDNTMNSLVKAPVEIKDDCTFIVHYKDFHLLGTVEYYENNAKGYLYLVVSKKRHISETTKDIAFKGIYCFYLKNLLTEISSDTELFVDEINIISGVSLRINADDIPQVKKEYLIPHENNEFDQGDFTNINYGFYKDEFETNLRNNKNYDFKIFARKVLMGHDGNIIIANSNTATKTSGTYQYRDIDYGEIYFNSFIYTIIYEPEKEDKEIYRYLYKALLHGLKLDIVQTKLKQLFVKNKVDKKKQDEIFLIAFNIRETIMQFYKSGDIKKIKDVLNEDENPDVQNNVLAKNVKKLIECLRQLFI